MSKRCVQRGTWVLAAGLVALTAAGCYTKVVGAKGLGADQYQIEERYQENSKLDDWVYGEKPAKSRSLLTERTSK